MGRERGTKGSSNTLLKRGCEIETGGKLDFWAAALWLAAGLAMLYVYPTPKTNESNSEGESRANAQESSNCDNNVKGNDEIEFALEEWTDNNILGKQRNKIIQGNTLNQMEEEKVRDMLLEEKEGKPV